MTQDPDTPEYADMKWFMDTTLNQAKANQEKVASRHCLPLLILQYVMHSYFYSTTSNEIYVRIFHICICTIHHLSIEYIYMRAL